MSELLLQDKTIFLDKLSHCLKTPEAHLNYIEKETVYNNAHLEMASTVRNYQGKANFELRPQTRIAAVLLLLYRHKDAWFFPTILRPQSNNIQKHGGQIALPGGGIEPEDKEDLITTALREAHEEIGVTVPRSRVIGKLSPLYIPPSDTIVTPVVAYLSQKPLYKLDYDEVDKVFDIPLNTLFIEENKKITNMRLPNDILLEVPYFDVMPKPHLLWGATAMMLNEFVSLVKS
ncbi:MAG: CoA pyrophosphatase [Bernardetiaceae bacterium]|nr:CoA pyrophosphatase [Bernardetiaceae bacterium]